MAEKKISEKSELRSRRRSGQGTDCLVQILLNAYKGSDEALPPELESLKEELQGELTSPALLKAGKPLDHHSMGFFPHIEKEAYQLARIGKTDTEIHDSILSRHGTRVTREFIEAAVGKLQGGTDLWSEGPAPETLHILFIKPIKVRKQDGGRVTELLAALAFSFDKKGVPVSLGGWIAGNAIELPRSVFTSLRVRGLSDAAFIAVPPDDTEPFWSDAAQRFFPQATIIQDLSAMYYPLTLPFAKISKARLTRERNRIAAAVAEEDWEKASGALNTAADDWGKVNPALGAALHFAIPVLLSLFSLPAPIRRAVLQGIDMHPIADEMISQEKFRQTGLRADPMKRLYFAQLHSEPDWAKPVTRFSQVLREIGKLSEGS